MIGLVLVPILGDRVAVPQGPGGLAWGILGELLSGGILGMAAGLIVAGRGPRATWWPPRRGCRLPRSSTPRRAKS